MAGRRRLVLVAWMLSVPLVFAAAAAPYASAASSTPSPPGATTTISNPATGRGTAAAASNRGDVAFVNGGDLYLASHTTGAVRRLTWGGGRADPAFSPDGRQIAYDRAGDIWLLTVGGGTRRLTFSSGASDPAWSPDGRTVAYTRVVAVGQSEIFQIPAAGGAATRLTWAASSGCSATQPQWQAGSGWVDYVRTNPGGGSCTSGIVRRKVGSAGQLLVPDRYASGPVVTSDGRHLVYLAPCDPRLCPNTGIWSATTTGGGRHTTTPLSGWSCAEGDMCVEAISPSPFGGWAQEGTWSDPDTGEAITCFQGVLENPDGSVAATAPSQCLSGILGAFTVRPA